MDLEYKTKKRAKQLSNALFLKWRGVVDEVRKIIDECDDKLGLPRLPKAA